MIPDLIEFIYANLELSRLFKVSVKPLQSVWMSEAVWNRVGARGTLFDFLVRLITAFDQTIPWEIRLRYTQLISRRSKPVQTWFRRFTSV